MELEEIIGLHWGTDVSKTQIAEITGADTDDIRVLKHDEATSAEFLAGRVSIWLDEHNRVAQITHETRGGSLLIVPSPPNPDPRR